MKSPEFLFFHVRVVRRKLKKGPEWIPFRWTHVDPDDSLVEGGVPTRKKTRGKYAGSWVWTNVPIDKAVVTQAELLAEMALYESETGNCADCFGDGQETAGWSLKEGIKFRPCGRCGATGKKAA